MQPQKTECQYSKNERPIFSRQFEKLTRQMSKPSTSVSLGVGWQQGTFGAQNGRGRARPEGAGCDVKGWRVVKKNASRSEIFSTVFCHAFISKQSLFHDEGATMVTLKGHKRCDYQDPENPELRCYRQPSFNFFGSVGGIFCHQHKVQLHHRGT